MNRRLVFGDDVVIRPSAVDALKREGYVDVPTHKPAKVIDAWTSYGRRVLVLGLRLQTHECGAVHVLTWANQVRLANGSSERESLATEKRVAEMVAAKAAREAARRKPKGRKTT